MNENARVRADRFVLMACGAGAVLMSVLTLGAADVGARGINGPAVVAVFVAMGLVPYGLTAGLSAIRPLRRLVLATTRAVAVVYGLFDCGLRYLALYHPQGSTDALVVAVLPFWWLPTLAVVAAVAAATLWLLSRKSGRPAFA